MPGKNLGVTSSHQNKEQSFFFLILSSQTVSEVQPNNVLIHVRQTSVFQISFLWAH